MSIHLLSPSLSGIGKAVVDVFDMFRLVLSTFLILLMFKFVAFSQKLKRQQSEKSIFASSVLLLFLCSITLRTQLTLSISSQKMGQKCSKTAKIHNCSYKSTASHLANAICLIYLLNMFKLVCIILHFSRFSSSNAERSGTFLC
jgi:hypothetical protein